MRASRTLGLLVVALGAFGALHCTYAPDPKSGTLLCSAAHECPEGYTCMGTLCYKNGEAGQSGTAGTGAAGAAGTGAAGTGAAGTGAAGATGAAGKGGPPCAGTCTIKISGTLTNANPASTESKFIGHWVFDAGSTETVACTDGSNKTNDLAADYVDVTMPAGVLVGSYFCDWNLNVGPAGAATVIRAGQSCTRDMMDAKTGTTKFTWHGTTFTFMTTDSKTGTLASLIGVDYVDDTTATGCTP